MEKACSGWSFKWKKNSFERSCVQVDDSFSRIQSNSEAPRFLPLFTSETCVIIGDEERVITLNVRI